MVVVGNDQNEYLCHPGTDIPYQFETEEQAEYIIKRLGLTGAHIVAVSDIKSEERYGGQSDLW